MKKDGQVLNLRDSLGAGLAAALAVPRVPIKKLIVVRAVEACHSPPMENRTFWGLDDFPARWRGGGVGPRRMKFKKC